MAAKRPEGRWLSPTPEPSNGVLDLGRRIGLQFSPRAAVGGEEGNWEPGVSPAGRGSGVGFTLEGGIGGLRRRRPSIGVQSCSGIASINSRRPLCWRQRTPISRGSGRRSRCRRARELRWPHRSAPAPPFHEVGAPRATARAAGTSAHRLDGQQWVIAPRAGVVVVSRPTLSSPCLAPGGSRSW